MLGDIFVLFGDRSDEERLSLLCLARLESFFPKSVSTFKLMRAVFLQIYFVTLARTSPYTIRTAKTHPLAW